LILLVGLLTCKNRLPYNLYCVGGDVKHCSLTHSDNAALWDDCSPAIRYARSSAVHVNQSVILNQLYSYVYLVELQQWHPARSSNRLKPRIQTDTPAISRRLVDINSPVAGGPLARRTSWNKNWNKKTETVSASLAYFQHRKCFGVLVTGMCGRLK